MPLNRRLTRVFTGWLLAAATVPAAVAALPASSASAALAPQGYGTSVRLTGHGFGHGLGMGQVGAYGYATHFGWTWQQILGHFYPATTLAHANPNTAMTVKLSALDDRLVTAVVQDGGQLATSANGSIGRFKSIAAVAFAPGHYRVYARVDAVNCPSATTTTAFQAPGSPWKIVASDVASVDITTPAVNTSTAPVQSLPGVCEPDGDQFGAFAARYYRGSLRAVTGSQGELRTVNSVPLNLYVAGVVPREMPASWGGDAGGKGMNALRAQAVAARSYSLASNRYTYAKICDNQNCQVYGGAGYRAAVNAPGGPTPIVGIESPFSNQAVADTSGVVVTSGGAVVSTLYAASTGGYTATGIIDKGDQYSPFSNYHTWTTTIAVGAIQAAYPQIGVLTDLSITKRNGFGDLGGRVLTMDVIGTAGRVSTTGGDFRSRLGLRSDWFAVPTACDGRGAPPPTGLPTAAPGRFTPLTPRRIVDTRSGIGTARVPLAAGCTIAIRVGGGVVPSGASAVALNLTATQASAAGFLTAYPCGEPQPTASNLNYTPGESIANMAVVRLGAGGEVCIATMSKVHLVVDVLGWYSPQSGSGFVSLAPRRVMDTRDGTGIGGVRRAVLAGGVQSLTLTGVVVPRGASSVVLNVTDTESGADGYVTVYPCGTAPPLASNIDYRAGQTIANQVVVGLGVNGSVCFTTFATSHIVVDVLGWYGATAPAAYAPLAPARLLDTRAPNTIARGPIGAGRVVALPVLGRGGVPSSGVKAAVLNVTVDQSGGPGYVAAFPCGTAVPLASNLDYVVGQVAANLVTVPIGSGGRVCLYTYAPTQIVVDVAGYFR